MTGQTVAKEKQADTARKGQSHPRKAKHKEAEVQGLIGVVREAVDHGVTTAEEIHHAIADVPFGVLERVGLLASPEGGIRRLHDETAAAIYDLVRDVNRQVTRFAADLVEQVDERPLHE